MERIGKMAYRLALPPSTSIHPVFHVSQPRKVIGDRVVVPTLPPMLTDDIKILLEPTKLGGVCHGLIGTHSDLEVLIKWQGMPDYDTTWEPYSLIVQQFSSFDSFHLEDKVTHWQGSIVRPARTHTYARRKSGN